MSEKSMNEMADQAMKNYQQAWQTGLKFQEEATRWWSTIWNQAANTPDWQKRLSKLTALANNVLPMAQKRLQEVTELMEKSSRAGAELMRKAAEAAQTGSAAESQARWIDFWVSSLGTMRANVEALNQINTKTLDSWISFVRQHTELGEMPKAA